MRAVRVSDVHCHFFSTGFLETLTADRRDLPARDRAPAVAGMLGWDAPGTPDALADRWVGELDRHGVARAALIASIPGDEESVAAAVIRHPARFVGFFMYNPVAPDAAARLTRALGELKLRAVALFPAMPHYRLDDERVARVFEMAARLLPTPRATDGEKGCPGQRGSHGDLTLPSAAVRVLSIAGRG